MDGADPDDQNNAGNTALIIASRWRYTEIFKLLLQYGANPNIQNYKGETALSIMHNSDDIIMSNIDKKFDN